MTLQAAASEFTDGSGQMTAADGRGPAPVQIVVAYGFWIFLLSDIIMFSALFATYAVLSGQTAGGPSAHDLFDVKNAAVETGCLLFSSYSCGLGMLAIERRRLKWFYAAFAVTFVLGAIFLTLELTEFSHLIAQGAGPVAQRLSVVLF